MRSTMDPIGWRFPAEGRDAQAGADAAVVMVTILRPCIVKAVESVYRQEFRGTIQLMIAVDKAAGPIEPLLEILRERPKHVEALVLHPGYSTAERHGGLYSASDGGAARTVLSYMAKSRLLAYLDDDNEWLPGHLGSLARAIDGFDWAYSLRTFVDERDGRDLCVDMWDSTGPGRGIRKQQLGGFVDVNCLMLDKMRCPEVLPLWTAPLHEWRATADRRVFLQLRERHSVAWTGLPTVRYSIRPTYFLWPQIRAHLGAHRRVTETR
jgi:hypothetical protein